MNRIIAAVTGVVIMATTLSASLSAAPNPNNNAEQLAIALIAKYESFRATPYKCLGGCMSIGYGFTDPEIVAKGRITQKEADRLLGIRVRSEIEWVKKTFPQLKKPGQIAAVASLAYNVGRGKVVWKVVHGQKVHTNAYGYLIKGDVVSASREIKGFNKASGVVVGGLVKRRAEEVRYLLA